MSRFTDPNTVAAVATGGPSPSERLVSSSSSLSASEALLKCQREVLTLQAALQDSHTREHSLFEQLCQRDACCREAWPSLLLHYASSQRQLLLQQHQAHLDHVDELLFTFRSQQEHRAAAHLREMTLLGTQIAERHQRVRARAQTAAAEIERGMALAALESQQQTQAVQAALHATTQRLSVALDERDAALRRVADLEHAHRTLIAAHAQEAKRAAETAAVLQREQWIDQEALRRAYDALFVSWAATQSVCQALAPHCPDRVQAGKDVSRVPRAIADKAPTSHPTAPENGEDVCDARQQSPLTPTTEMAGVAEAVVRQLCARAPPPPLLLAAETDALDQRPGTLVPVSPQTEPPTTTVYDHIRLCAQQHALLRRSTRICDEAQALQDDWKARLALVEKQAWAPRVVRKVLGQDFAARLDQLVHVIEDAHPHASAVAVPPEPMPRDWEPERDRATVPLCAPVGSHKAKAKRPVKQDTVLPPQAKPRFAF